MTTFKAKPDAPVLKMATKAYQDLAQGERIAPIYGYVGIALTICFFQLINTVVTSRGPLKRVNADFFKWKNLCISWIHALIVGTWDISCFWLYPEMAEDLIEHYNWYTYSMVVFSTGYFIYDFLDLARAGKLFSSWEIILHHWAVISMFFYDVITCRCIAYNVVALMAEANSFFLHSRKLLQMMQVDFSSRLYRVVCFLNLLSFLPCRFGAVSVIIYGMFTLYERVTFAYYAMLFIAMSLMTPINFILYWRLLKSDILRSNSKKVKTPSKYGQQQQHTNANNNINKNLLEEASRTTTTTDNNHVTHHLQQRHLDGELNHHSGPLNDVRTKKAN